MDNLSIVSITGLDATGKTTQARILRDKLREEGINSKYKWMGLKPRILKPVFEAYEMMVFGQERTKGKAESRIDAQQRTNHKKSLFSKPFVGKLYNFGITCDYLLTQNYSLQIQHRNTEILVCDRYLHDVIVDLSVILNEYDDFMDRYYFLQHLFPEPDMIFYIDLDPEVAYERKNDIPSLDYLTQRRKLYHDFANELDVVVIDGEQTIDEVGEAIYNEIIENH